MTHTTKLTESQIKQQVNMFQKRIEESIERFQEETDVEIRHSIKESIRTDIETLSHISPSLAACLNEEAAEAFN